jgi:hypothetical protein
MALRMRADEFMAPWITGGGAPGKRRTGWPLAVSGWRKSSLLTRMMTVWAAHNQARGG